MKLKSKLLAALFTALCLAGCVEKRGANTTVNKVAVIGPMTGSAAIYGEWLRKGIESAVNGGVTNISFDFMDSGGDPKTAVTLAQKALSSDTTMAIWATTSGENMAIREMATRAGVAIITSSATSPDITDGREGIFRTIINSAQETQVMVDFAVNTLKPHKVAILYINDAGGSASLKQFKNYFSEKGVAIVFEDSFEKNSQDVRMLTTKVMKSLPDLVVVTGYSAAMGEVVKGIRLVSQDIRIICNQGLDTPENMSLPRDILNRIYYSIADVDEKIAESKFGVDYKNQYKKAPGLYEVTAFDTANLLSQAMKVAVKGRKELSEQLRHAKHQGLNGLYTFTSKGNVMKDVAIRKLDHGKSVAVSKQRPVVE